MGCLVGGNRGARCPFPLPTMVTWQGRCPTTGLLTSPFVVRSPPLCCPRSGLTILLFSRMPLTVVWFPSGVHPDAAGFSAVGIALAWLRRLSGVTTHWMAGSLFSYMTWCKSSATWLQQDVDRTTERDEQLLGLIAPAAKCRPMDIFGVVQSRLLRVPLRRRHLIPCVLHLLIFVGRQVTHCLGTQIGQVCASQY